MPVEWTKSKEEAPALPGAFAHEGGRPFATLRLWPHRSLPLTGFAGIMGFTGCMFLVPLAPFIGTPVFWGLLPFLCAAMAALYLFFLRNYRDGELTEELTVWSDRIELVRYNPRSPKQMWEANPYWIRLSLHPDRGPVQNYLTMNGGGREVELGAFLSPEEREAVYDDLDRLLKRLPR